jgi:hypothetical protein
MVNENYINKSDLVELSMVNALVTLDENTNRVLNTVKSKYNLKDKGEAITFVVNHYIEEVNEPELRPEFIKELERIRKGKFYSYNSIEELKADIAKNAKVSVKRRS